MHSDLASDDSSRLRSRSSERRSPEIDWLGEVPPQGKVLLLAPSEPGRWLELSTELGLQARWMDTTKEDPRLAPFGREEWDAAQWILDGSVPLYPLEHLQRVFLSLLQSLKPKSGRLAFEFPQGRYEPVALQSLLRQSGFRLLSEWSHLGQSLWILNRP